MVGAMPVNLIPKFCNGGMDFRNGGEEGEKIRVGSRVKCGDDFGTVKYIGEVQGYKDVWYGIEWDNSSRGKHDGSVDGVHYFKTAKPGAGSFVRPSKIASFQSCAEAIRKYYGDREDETVAAHRKTIINEWKREMGAPFIEMVGFEKIRQKQKLDRLVEICVHDQCVSTAGDVAALCRNARSVDISGNLFSSWREVLRLSAQLPRLRELDVSKNRMAIDMPEGTLAQLSIHFNNLEKLKISMCDYEWSDLLTLSHLWPKVTEIFAAYNRIQKISPPKNTLCNLTSLCLDGNPIDNWKEVLNLGLIKDLKVLSLNDCLIEKIRFGNCGYGEKVDVFENLEVLFLNRNRVNEWRSISELNKLKSLKRLYFMKNKIQEDDDYDTASQMIVARIGTLVELNGSRIVESARRGAEYDYMNLFGAEWKLTRDDPVAKKKFNDQHCRFEQLIKKYGIPEDSLLERKAKNTTLTSQLMEITLRDENGKEFKKKFPASMQVQKLVTLAQRLFRAGHTGSPVLYVLDDDMQAEIPLDNNMKELSYYSIKPGDVILVKYR